ncbi:MAG: hypothetical protein RRB13_07140 [bacterium]|nr:hypothetical protein [bacterium]
MDNLEIQKGFYHPVCNESEIERIFNVQNSNDHLLKLRADTIVDHMRLFRVYRNKAIQFGEKWSLEASFQDLHYKSVLQKLGRDEAQLCGGIAFGGMFSNDPNGSIFQTDWGIVSTISESLQFFLKFLHLAVLEFEQEVPDYVRLNALRIAIRVMLKTETLDFFMDPRGIIPNSIEKTIASPIPYQMQFIAGHEFAHYLLGHLSNGRLLNQPIFHAISPNDTEYGSLKVFNPSQRDEFDADLQSILLPSYNSFEKSQLLEAALLWFGCLELFEHVKDIMFPTGSTTYKTHPSARERFDNLLTNVPTPQGFETTKWSGFLKLVDSILPQLSEDVSVNWEHYEFYGSVYLDEPNSQWRGPELIDRVDYY